MPIMYHWVILPKWILTIEIKTCSCHSLDWLTLSEDQILYYTYTNKKQLPQFALYEVDFRSPLRAPSCLLLPVCSFQVLHCSSSGFHFHDVHRSSSSNNQPLSAFHFFSKSDFPLCKVSGMSAKVQLLRCLSFGRVHVPRYWSFLPTADGIVATWAWQTNLYPEF